MFPCNAIMVWIDLSSWTKVTLIRVNIDWEEKILTFNSCVVIFCIIDASFSSLKIGKFLFRSEQLFLKSELDLEGFPKFGSMKILSNFIYVPPAKQIYEFPVHFRSNFRWNICFSKFLLAQKNRFKFQAVFASHFFIRVHFLAYIAKNRLQTGASSLFLSENDATVNSSSKGKKSRRVSTETSFPPISKQFLSCPI